MTMAQLLTDYLNTQPSPPALSTLILSVADRCAQISAEVRRAALLGILGEAGSGNVQGETQKKLDVIANDMLLQAGIEGGVFSVASEEMDNPVPGLAGKGGQGDQGSQGRYLLLFDPLDGSSNIDVNVSIGTIFSILKAPATALAEDHDMFLQAGSQQAAAGYVVYGPCTQLVISLGKGVAEFILDHNQWWLTNPQMQIPKETKEFSINASNARHWHAPVKRYVDEMLAGKGGPLKKDFNMRWVGSMVADVHRVLTRGGIFMYPQDAREPDKPGKLRLMYEANPMAFLVEQAGGAATNGTSRILDLSPSKIHERVAVFMGSQHEVDRVTGYHLTGQHQ
jgi:fructose-1,6-bisphosphatase I